MNRIFLAILIFFFSINVGYSQQDNTLFFMHELPQANLVNPAVPSTCKLFIGLPVLSSVSANYSNTALAVREVFDKKQGADSLYLNPDKILSRMRGKELVTSDVDLTLFTMGIHVKKYYLTFSINEKATTYNMIPADMAKLAWYGNSKDFTGKEASANGTRVNANNYHEFAFGASRNVSDKWRVGVRAKALFGLGNVFTPTTKGYLFTDKNSFALSLILNSNVKSSLPLDVSTDSFGKVTNIALRDDANLMDYFLNFRNFGIGADIGFINYFDDKTIISGSLLDVGAIFWSKDTYKFISEGRVSYAGITPAGNNVDWQQFVDSLQNMFTPSKDSSRFSSPLVPKIYIGATRKVHDHINVGALVRTELYRNRLHPSLTLSANTFGFDVFNASVSYTLQNGEFTNIGAGIGVKAGPVQLHLISDNIPGFFMLDNTRNVNIRFGISIIPGCNERVETEPSGGNGIKPLPCYYSPYKKTRKRRK